MAKRRSNSKKTNPVFFVLYDGNTEKQYLNLLNGIFTTKIKSIYKPQGIQKGKIDRTLTNNYFDASKDKLFILADLDVEPETKKLLEMDGILLGSNPCIELWFLLHYKDQTGFISSDKCKNKEIQGNHCSNYSPGKSFPSEMLVELETSYMEACKRAKNLNFPGNPSSTVYKLIEALVERS